MFLLLCDSAAFNFAFLVYFLHFLVFCNFSFFPILGVLQFQFFAILGVLYSQVFCISTFFEFLGFCIFRVLHFQVLQFQAYCVSSFLQFQAFCIASLFAVLASFFAVSNFAFLFRFYLHFSRQVFCISRCFAVYFFFFICFSAIACMSFSNLHSSEANGDSRVKWWHLNACVTFVYGQINISVDD